MFHIDHFRPQKHFPHLENQATNLVWACCRCNLLKRDYWPALKLGEHETIDGLCGYIDPFEVDRNEYFQVTDNGELEGLKAPSKYLIERLALNRPFLRLNRLRRSMALRTWMRLEAKEYSVREKKYYAQKRLESCEDNSERAADLKELIDSYDDYLALIMDYREKIAFLL